jgi:hypothetical protein
MPLALALLALAAPRHTPSGCAIAWNMSATPAQHSRVAQSNAAAAFIDARVALYTDTWTKTGGAKSTAGGPGCEIEFVLPAGKRLAVWKAWSAGVWHVVESAASFPVPHNARVHTDGTVGFTG